MSSIRIYHQKKPSTKKTPGEIGRFCWAGQKFLPHQKPGAPNHFFHAKEFEPATWILSTAMMPPVPGIERDSFVSSIANEKSYVAASFGTGSVHGNTKKMWVLMIDFGRHIYIYVCI